jgi:hypothetical protein
MKEKKSAAGIPLCQRKNTNKFLRIRLLGKEGYHENNGQPYKK